MRLSDLAPGLVLGDGAVPGGGAVLLPGVEIGEEAFVAVVTRDVPARSVVMGVPARVLRDVPDETCSSAGAKRSSAAARQPCACRPPSR